MSDDTVLLTRDRLAAVICVFRQLKSLEEQFIALGMLAESVMERWPSHTCMAMLTSLELRLGLSGLFDQRPAENVMPN